MFLQFLNSVSSCLSTGWNNYAGYFNQCIIICCDCQLLMRTTQRTRGMMMQTQRYYIFRSEEHGPESYQLSSVQSLTQVFLKVTRTDNDYMCCLRVRQINFLQFLCVYKYIYLCICDKHTYMQTASNLIPVQLYFVISLCYADKPDKVFKECRLLMSRPARLETGPTEMSVCCLFWGPRKTQNGNTFFSAVWDSEHDQGTHRERC